MLLRTLSIVGVTLVVAAPATLADYATYIELPDAFSANDMTPDGKYMVGDYNGGGSYIWSLADGFTIIPGGSATAVSDDGQTLFGNISNELGQQEAAIWTQEDGWVGIGTVPAGTVCGSLTSAYEMTADGTGGVGLAWVDGCNGNGFLLTPDDGMIPLQNLHNGTNRASVVSADGQVVGGFAQGNFNRTPAIWSGDGSGEVFDPDVIGEVHGISDDGTIILGEWDGSAFYKIGDDPRVDFPTVISSWTGIATEISDAGTIVGFDVFGNSRIAWVRPIETGITQQLTTYLVDLGATGVPSQLQVCQGISTNGRFMHGHGAFVPAWYAIIHPDEDVDGDGFVGVGDLLALLAEWGACPKDCVADFNDDGMVDIGDLLQLLAAWD